MKNQRFFILTALLMCLSAPFITAHQCDAPDKASNGLCTLSGGSLRPTQFTLGMVEIACRANRFKSLYQKGKLDDYLEDHVVPVVAGNSDFFILDHHHMIAALMAAKLPMNQIDLYLNVTHSIQDKQDDVFWAKMKYANLTWNRAFNRPMPVMLMPLSVDRLINDLFRGLCYFVRKAGGYGRTVPDTLYQDFIWADFFRVHIPAPPIVAQYEYARFCVDDPYAEVCIGDVATTQMTWVSNQLSLALSLAKSNAASHLPGFGIGTVKKPKCS